VFDAVARLRTGRRDAKFRTLSAEEQACYSLLTGKGADGKPVEGHMHLFLWLLPDQQEKPTRLVCYRRTPFDAMEQEAIFAASEQQFSWQFGNSDWLLRLVPLPTETPLSVPITTGACRWQTLTPYVPSRHLFARNGKPKPGYSVAEQVQTDLANAGLPKATVTVAEEARTWVKVHRPKRLKGDPTNDLKLSYNVHLDFGNMVRGPIALGHSSHFGLGLFAPALDGQQPRG